MDEFARIVGWLTRIGESEVLLSEISRNNRKAREVVDLLGKYGLINYQKKGRFQLVSLSHKGLEAYRHILAARRVIYGEEITPREPLTSKLPERSSGPEMGIETSSELPSYLRDNPWLEVLASRSRGRVFG